MREIGKGVFSYCRELEEVHLSGISVLPAECFAGCYMLSKFEAKELTGMGTRCFDECVRLDYFDFSGIKKIGERAFERCDSLKTVKLSKAECGYHAFADCPKAPRMTIMNIRPEIANVKDYIGWNAAKIFVAGKSSIGSGPLWFVFTLYSVSLIFYLVQKMAGKAKRIARVVVAAVAVVALAAGWLLNQKHMRYPLGLERDLTVLFFFACGWLSRDAIKKFGRAHAVVVAAVAAVSFALYAYFEVPNPNFSIMNNDLGKSFVGFFASSVSGIVGLVALFQLLSRVPNVAPVRIFKGILRNISRNALVILAVHWWILLVMRLLFKPEINRPGIAYLSILVVVAGVIGAIPLFRCKLYKLLGKERISVHESLSIK